MIIHLYCIRVCIYICYDEFHWFNFYYARKGKRARCSKETNRETKNTEGGGLCDRKEKQKGGGGVGRRKIQGGVYAIEKKNKKNRGV